MQKKTGFIGLGNMGFGMASNLQKEYGPIAVWNRSQGKIDEMCKQGAIDGQSAKQMASKCDVIILSLPAPKDVRSVVGAKIIPNGKKGLWIIDTSTVDPQTSREMHEMALEKGIEYLDCPVSGGKDGADAGTLTFMVGDTKEHAQPIEPYLNVMGKTIHYMGNSGGGSAIKVINNFMSFSAAVINAEAINMAEHMDIPLEKFYEVILSSSGGNNNLKGKMKKVLANDLEASFTVNPVLKDLELAADLCRSAGIPNFSASNAIQWFRLAQKHGYADKDASSLVYIFRELTND